MNNDSAHNGKWEIAEVVFGIPFLISLALHFAIPIPLPQGSLEKALLPVGILLMIISIGLIISGRRELARYAQPTDPGHPTSRLVKTGIFAISRNPLYLASVLFFLSITLALKILWAAATLPVSILLCIYVLIIPEERYLAARFGREYQEYAASVQRWLGRK